MSSTAPGSEGPSTAAAAPLGPPGPRLLVLLRHGESEWNKANRFTGWVDVDITEQGKRQATRAGALMRAHLGHGDRAFDVAFTSVLRRAIRTLHMAEDVMELLHLEEVKNWRLNERHYGALQGLNKAETAARHGEEQVHIWRRSYATQPPALDPTDPLHPCHDPRYRGVDPSLLPATESLKDCVARCVPFWESHIAPALAAGRRVLVAAHGNSLRGLVKHLDDISDQDIMKLEIPVGAPLVYELDEQLSPVRRYYLGAGLVAAPPLGVALLLPSGCDEGAEGDGGGQEGKGKEVAAAARGAMQALAKALLHTGVTTPDHLRLVSPREPAALAADGRAAEQLAAVPSTQALSSCSYLLTALIVGPDGGVDTAGAGGIGVGRTDPGVRAMEPAAPHRGVEVEGGVQGGGGKAGATGSSSSSAGLELCGLEELEAVAQHLEVEKHVVVVVLLPREGSGSGAGVGGGGMQVQQVDKGGEEGPQLDLGLVSRRVTEVIGGRSKMLVAAPAGIGAGGAVGGGQEKGEQEQEEESLMMGGGRVWDAVPRAWRQGGRVHAAGCAGAEEAEMVASVLSCSTGSVWGVEA